MSTFPQLIVIAWQYGGDANNGMPNEGDKKRMETFEGALEDGVIAKGLGIHAVTRTGNGLKEFEYYFSDQEQFMSHFNEAMAPFERFPIDIKFYNDPNWDELQRFIDMIK